MTKYCIMLVNLAFIDYIIKFRQIAKTFQIMSNHTWSRPNSIAFPTVWTKFTRTMNDGNVIQLEIEDITEDLFPTCVEYMLKYFVRDEPMFASLEFAEDEISKQEQTVWWNNTLKEKLSLMCRIKAINDVTLTEPKIVGINFLYYHHKSQDEYMEYKSKGEKLQMVFDIVQTVEDNVDHYSVLGIDEYLDELGLCVHPEYRCMGIAKELLKAREPLMKALGLNTTITMFTAIASQKAAVAVGFKNLYEMKYSDLRTLFPSWLLDVKDTPTMRYMYKTIV